MAPLRQLRRVFERAQDAHGVLLPIRKTGSGIWVPTPVPVIEQAVELLTAMGHLGAGAPPGHLIDAGSGDGRVAAVLALGDPTRTVYGIEADPVLHTQAAANLESLGLGPGPGQSGIQLIEADYTAEGTYRTRAIALGETHIVFNYPDGNQRRLATFVSDHCAPSTLLCLLTHDRTLDLEELDLRERWDVDAGSDPAWRMSLYARTH